MSPRLLPLGCQPRPTPAAGTLLFVLFVVPLVWLAALGAGAASAGDPPIEAFFGSYQGRVRFLLGEDRDRDLSVDIRPFADDGFTIAWQTVIMKDGKALSRAMTADFVPTGRPGLYKAVTAGRAAPDPAVGDDYLWARLAGRTLTVNILTIDDTGDVLVASYARTLSVDALRLQFQRTRNGVAERRIKSVLTRAPAADNAR